MTKKKVKATKLVVNLPFGIGKLEIEPQEAEEKAAWELYVELSTRIAVQPMSPNEGLIREALSSLYTVFSATRHVLRAAGPSIAQRTTSLGPIAIDVLNKGIRPFLSKWHPLLLSYEQTRPPDTGLPEFEARWSGAPQFWNELGQLNEQMLIYTSALASIARVTAPPVDVNSPQAAEPLATGDPEDKTKTI